MVVTVSYSLWLCVPKTLSTQFILTEQISQSWNWISGLNVVINYKSDQRDKVVSDSVVKSFPQQTSLNVSQVHNLLKASTDQKLINSQKSTVNVSDQGSNLTPKLAHEKKTHDHQDCRDVLCTEYLTKEDWENFYKCWRPRRKGRGKTSAAEVLQCYHTYMSYFVPFSVCTTACACSVISGYTQCKVLIIYSPMIQAVISIELLCDYVTGKH